MKQPVEYTLSPQLSELLHGSQDTSLSGEMSLRDLVRRLIEHLGVNSPNASLLFPTIDGVWKKDEILRQLGCVLGCDSVVRDVATTGHLAKLLARAEICRALADWRIAGLPHPFFDRVSWVERQQVMKLGVCHPCDPDLLDHPEVRRLLEDEARSCRAMESSSNA